MVHALGTRKARTYSPWCGGDGARRASIPADGGPAQDFLPSHDLRGRANRSDPHKIALAGLLNAAPARTERTSSFRGSGSGQFRLVKDVRLGLFSPESVKRGGTRCALVMTPRVGSRNGRQYESAPHHGAADKSHDALMGLVTGGAGCCHWQGKVRTTMKSEQRILAVLGRARFEAPQSGGWMETWDVWERIERNRFGFRMNRAWFCITLVRLNLKGFVEAKPQDESAPLLKQRFMYRITEHGHGERARRPVHVRGSRLGRLRLQPSRR